MPSKLSKYLVSPTLVHYFKLAEERVVSTICGTLIINNVSNAHHTTTTTNNISRRSILQMLLQILWHRGGGVAVLIRKFREHSSIFKTATLSPWTDTDTFQHMFCLACCPHRFNQELTRFQKTIQSDTKTYLL